MVQRIVNIKLPRSRADGLPADFTGSNRLPDDAEASAQLTSVWLTIEQIQLVANRVVFRCGLIVRKGL
jgi:hypothetical protein